MIGSSESARQRDVQEWQNGPYTISTARARLDVDLIHGFLTRDFWDSQGIPRDVVDRSIEHSLCFGVYEGEQQVGFARAVTDRATFAFISDDFVVASHRGRGLATWLMQCILAHPDLQGLRRIMLVTRDPRLYAKSGFTPLEKPGEYMELRQPDLRSTSAREPRGKSPT